MNGWCCNGFARTPKQGPIPGDHRSYVAERLEEPPSGNHRRVLGRCGDGNLTTSPRSPIPLNSGIHFR